MRNYKPVFYKGLATNVEVNKLGNIKKVKTNFCTSYNLGVMNIEDRLPKSNGYYLISIQIENIGFKFIYVHQLIAAAFLGYEFGGELVVDHIDNNKLNNRLDNLQVISNRENISKGLALYRDLPTGVHYISNRDVYRARIQINKKKISLGYYKDPITASKAYNKALKQLSC